MYNLGGGRAFGVVVCFVKWQKSLKHKRHVSSAAIFPFFGALLFASASCALLTVQLWRCRCCALLAFASCVEVPTVYGGVAGEGAGGGKEEVDLVKLAETSHALMQVRRKVMLSLSFGRRFSCRFIVVVVVAV